jgi:DNA-binding response OmpR family regulator
VAGFDRGADEYLTKPFDIEELDETLQRLVAAARAQASGGGR